MDARYRIVFSGQIKDGFDLALVRKVASLRLKAPLEQIERIFSGRKTVIKHGLTEKAAALYLAELDKLGMLARAEPESASEHSLASAPTPNSVEENSRDEKTAPLDPEPAQTDSVLDAVDTQALESAFDPDATQFSSGPDISQVDFLAMSPVRYRGMSV